MRTADQTLTARFFADTPVGPIQAALRDFATRHALDISDSARLFAAVETSVADSLAAVWWAKHKYMWWRPITAIREADTDGDSMTAGVPGWTPLITSPPYPEWPSGLCSVVGAVSTVVSRLNGGPMDLYITSPAAGPRYYADPHSFRSDAVDARVWSGLHFRTADQVSITIGTQVGNYALDHYFAPTD
jgi:hypothetical protein